MQFSARTRFKNKQAVNIRVIFLYNWTHCIDGFSLLLQRYVRKGNDAKDPAILSFCLLRIPKKKNNS